MTWKIIGDSVAGTRHHAADQACQDAFRFQLHGPHADWLSIIVADGAGTAAHAADAATFVCDAFVEAIQSAHPDQLGDESAIRHMIGTVRNQLAAVASVRQSPPRDWACTLLLAVIGPTHASFAQIGDGAIVIEQHGDYRTVFWPSESAYANETDFLIDDHWENRLNLRIESEPIHAIALFTDGLQRLALQWDTHSVHAPFFDPMFQTLRQAACADDLLAPLRAFLDSARVNARTDDDKTLVLATRP
ncbi:serine threonine protein phosphatase : Serine/threonine protein phosphatase OS=Myxococcus stipitatus (strain DSM 14675 / JCM 12634 / Mx s8) GN=MYSTI_02389 PE=4 SV=1: PP2C_2 [Tuwongella immobilis]|uniref:PPM-type phosphatase domain-containing protein n=2 Tax=Tuwongella immobilis TaxID=692036 RepID=A0A6C2YVQ8_9BACT|nr:serine threonine protein phosphatase : Serine/threonine protein phosphatase OS=Myxococcus stipitatus (strain DSM 14675 / JCM 12634 / Mx s8) GN=MYSTI_02389 PE=4 SV=1: PP2C_2 [Tuwongella immobilis]VTS07494.1 serine threonine protein phosphatase : Serine/threonine protein phosphatase OS=Myxococcus stipitatus (strain DSM 14675 / JCM 12634 / Mx s8) GN=MYSTI_02389 PE=4 SV=1: PP2C_2 [Tuwongella immobilis]